MFEICGYNVTYNDVKNENWDKQIPFYQYYTMTAEQNEQWKQWVISELTKRKMPKGIAERKYEFLSLNYGLKIKD